MPCRRARRWTFRTRIKRLQTKPTPQIKKSEEQLKNGPEKKELDEFEKELLKKLIAGKVRAARRQGVHQADLRLELKLLEAQRIFTGGGTGKACRSARGCNADWRRGGTGSA